MNKNAELVFVAFNGDEPVAAAETRLDALDRALAEGLLDPARMKIIRLSRRILNAQGLGHLDREVSFR